MIGIAGSSIDEQNEIAGKSRIFPSGAIGDSATDWVESLNLPFRGWLKASPSGEVKIAHAGIYLQLRWMAKENLDSGFRRYDERGT